MTARRMWALLLLAAVFSMHGVQCVAADAGAGHAPATTSAHAVVEPLHPVESMLGVAARHLTGPAGAMPGALDDGPPAHVSGFAVVCLAVLLTGVALLGVTSLLRRHGAFPLQPRAPTALARTGWFRLPRPPDLSALCLLRI